MVYWETVSTASGSVATAALGIDARYLQINQHALAIGWPFFARNAGRQSVEHMTKICLQSYTRLLAGGLSGVSILLTATTLLAQPVRVAHSWFSISKDQVNCLLEAEKAMNRIGYANVKNSSRSITGGTDNLTASVRCDMPGKVIIFFAYLVTPTDSEQESNMDRMGAELKSLK